MNLHLLLMGSAIIGSIFVTVFIAGLAAEFYIQRRGLRIDIDTARTWTRRLSWGRAILYAILFVSIAMALAGWPLASIYAFTTWCILFFILMYVRGKMRYWGRDDDATA